MKKLAFYPPRNIGLPGQIQWINPATGQPEWINPPMVDDFCASGIGTGGIGWTTTVANSGTVTVGGNVQGHYGVAALQSNALSNGTAVLRTVQNSGTGGGRKQRLLMCVQTPSALSDGTDRYQLWAGTGNSTGAEPTHGVYFDYIDTLNSGIWTPKTANGGSRTTASGGTDITVVAATWYWLYIEYDGIVAKFWVATEVAGLPGRPGAFTFVGSSSTNLPTANQYGLNFVMLKSLGTNNRSLTVDKVLFGV